MEKEILNITCPGCGAPAHFDIIHQVYACRYCGGKVGIESALKQKQDFKDARQKKIRETAKEYNLIKANCTGCGATLVFEENEALSNCEFCGRSLVRSHYVHDNDIPQSVIPFGLTKDEAKEKLLDWCNANRSKNEAREIKKKIDDLGGCYLPYQMITGPVTIEVQKSYSSPKTAYGYINDGFINCSKQFDNLLLDAMEPFDLEGLEEFDYGYVAGQCVKIKDLKDKTIDVRVADEVNENYRVPLEKMWGTKDIFLSAKIDKMIEMPVLLPVYYLSTDHVKAAVNGQTGKVSVRAEKDSRYISLPWWLKAIFVLLFALAATFGAAWLGTHNVTESFGYTGILGIFYLIVFLCMFADPSDNTGSIIKFRKIYTSGEETMRRVNGRLEPRPDILERRITAPVFFQEIDGKKQRVSYVFNSLKRILGMALLGVVIVFLPVVLALLINGFDFEQLEIGGSAVWLCITVPLVPILFIRGGIQFLYDNPAVYLVDEEGKKRRYHKKISFRKFTKDILPMILNPLSLLILAVFGFMVYLTAFGF